MAAKKRKLADQFDDESTSTFKDDVTRSNIFAGVHIYVNGYTKPSSTELREIIRLHGGNYVHYYSATGVTHIIASNLPQSKIQTIKKKIIVRPEWITDSVKAGKLLPDEHYYLYPSDQPTIQLSAPPIDNQQFQNALNEEICQNITSNTTSRAGDPNFISEFYSNSRLHHLSTWGQEFKLYVRHLQENHSGCFPGRNRLTSQIIGRPLVVAHSKGIGAKHQNPESLQFERKYYSKFTADTNKSCSLGPMGESEDRPAPGNVDDINSDVPCGPSGTPALTKSDVLQPISLSEIACCNYEARQFGLKNGMFMGEAKRLCPDLVSVPYEFEEYNVVSRSLYDIVASYTHSIEAVSCDEMLIDCTDILNETSAHPLDLARILRDEIVSQTGCTASAGLGPNVLLARLATRKAKPNGQYLVTNEEISEFMSSIIVRDLPGVGWSTTQKLNDISINTCGDLVLRSLNELRSIFGAKTGQMLYNYSRGIDDRQLCLEFQRKSVSAEINYGIRFEKVEEVLKFLTELSTEVSRRLKQAKLRGRTVTLKLKVRKTEAPKETAKFMGHGICDNLSKSVTLPCYTDLVDDISQACAGIYKQLNIDASDLRGIGIQVTKFESPSSKSSGAGILRFTSAVSASNKIPGNTGTSASSSCDIGRKPPNTTSKCSPTKRSRNTVTSKKSQPGIDAFLKAEKQFQFGHEQATDYCKKEEPQLQANTDVAEESGNDTDVILCESGPQSAIFNPSNTATGFVNEQSTNLPHIANQQPTRRLAFCGRTELEDIKALLDDWILDCGATQLPSSDDVAMVTELFQQMVQFHFLDWLIDLIRHLVCRKSSCNQEWIEALATIIEETQKSMVCHFGAELKLFRPGTRWPEK